MWFRKPKIIHQIDDFTTHKKRRWPLGSTERENLILLKYFAQDINKLTFEDLEEYRAMILDKERSHYKYIQTIKDLNLLLQYFRHKCSYKISMNVDRYQISSIIEPMKKKRQSRFISFKQAKKVQDLRTKGLSYREIARVMRRNVSLIHRWGNR